MSVVSTSQPYGESVLDRFYRIFNKSQGFRISDNRHPIRDRLYKRLNPGSFGILDAVFLWEFRVYEDACSLPKAEKARTFVKNTAPTARLGRRRGGRMVLEDKYGTTGWNIGLQETQAEKVARNEAKSSQSLF